MRIAQVHSSDRGGGAEATARLHHEELLRRGFEARLHVARKHRDADGVEQISYVRGPRGLRRATALVEQFTGRQYLYAPSFRALLPTLVQSADIVHLHSLHGASGYADVGRIAEFSRRVPLVLSIHDLWLLTGHCAHPLDCERWLSGCGQCPDLVRYPSIPRDGTGANFKRKRRVFSRTTAHLLAPSRWVADQITRSPILGHLPVTVVHSPIDTSTFCPGDRAAARAKLGLPASGKIILLAAQHLDNMYKGARDGLTALNRIEDPDAMLLIVGRQADLALAECRMPGVALAYQDDPAGLVDCYRAADVLLMPSRCETFGMVAAEAMACGTPVVAFAAGGLTDVLGADEGGLLVPPGDVDALAATLQLLLRDAPLRERLGRQASVRSKREFSIESHTDACLAVYRQLLEKVRAGLQRLPPGSPERDSTTAISPTSSVFATARQ